MNIEITKIDDNWYQADLKDLPGMPPIGRGENPEIAVSYLFLNILKEQRNIDWISKIDLKSLNISKY